MPRLRPRVDECVVATEVETFNTDSGICGERACGDKHHGVGVGICCHQCGNVGEGVCAHHEVGAVIINCSACGGGGGRNEIGGSRQRGGKAATYGYRNCVNEFFYHDVTLFFPNSLGGAFGIVSLLIHAKISKNLVKHQEICKKYADSFAGAR